MQDASMTSYDSTRRDVMRGLAMVPVTIGTVAKAATDDPGADTSIETGIDVHGGGPDLADNSAALRRAVAAMAARGGGTVRFGEGEYRFASDALGGMGISLPSNVAVR